MGNTRVLLIDDNDAFLAAASQYLTDFCEMDVVGTATTGEAGIRLAQRLQPDVVLLDFSMPGIDGPETARHLKALPNPPVVIMVSLNAETPYRQQAQLGGCDGFVSKASFTDEIAPLLEKFARAKR